MKSNRYILSRFEVYIRIGVHEILLQQKSEVLPSLFAVQLLRISLQLVWLRM